MKIILRLDDGGLIGHIKGKDNVAKLSAAEAQELGRLTEADRLRMHRLLELAGGAPLAELQQQQPQLQPPAKGRTNAVSKRKEPEARTGLGEAKRSRPRANGRRATSDMSHGSSFGGQNWEDKCREILQKVLDSLGIEQQWFDRPVDEYYIPGYYSKIKSPMDLGTMKGKLDSGQYRAPEEFCEDMRQVWENCISFNGKASKYGKIGDRSSAMFEELWAASGLDTSGSRHRRSTAGVAAAKYEPQEELEAKRPIRKQPSTRTLGTSKSARLVEEATAIPMDRDQMRQLAEWMGELEGEELEGAINIIRERGLGKGGAEEIELDFDALDNETLWALDDYMMQMKGGRRESVGKAGSFQVEPESEYESESDASMDEE